MWILKVAFNAFITICLGCTFTQDLVQALYKRKLSVPLWVHVGSLVGMLYILSKFVWFMWTGGRI